jgi:transposase
MAACLIIPDAKKQRSKEIRAFRTVTSELLALQDWLHEAGCTHIAMEATGVSWKPAWNVLEGQFELLVVNARHIKAVPGRKTDVRDAEWIADLLHHGLLKSSFIPPTAQRERRDLTRHRVSLVEDRARVVNRLQKGLEDTNVKLGDVATDILGKSARAMLDAMLGGQTDAQVLADLARGRLRTKRADLEQALGGVFKPHHRFLLSELLTQIATLDEAITRVSNEIATRMQDTEPTEQDQTAKQEDLSEQEQDQSSGTSQLSWAQAVNLLCTIAGMSRRTAEGILAEIGLDMDRFPSSRHLARLRRDVSGQQRKCRQPALRQDAQRQRLATQIAGGSRPCGSSYEEYLSVGEVTPLSRSSW